MTIRLIAASVLFVCVASAAPPAPKSLRLYVFDCGTLDAPDANNYQLKKEDVATLKMSALCFLVAHPKGTMIWDTGAVPDRVFPGMVRYASAVKPFATMLQEIGYTPADIKYLALSHFHWDHIGNANLFASSTWLTPKAERDIMFGAEPSPRTEPPNYEALRNAKTVFLAKDEYDVFGDKSVIIKAAPGHSPGHQVLYLNLPKTGRVVVSGDLYHYPEERARGLLPINEASREQTVASRASVEAYMKKTGAKLWIQHDFNASAKLKKSPEYYD